MRRALGPCLLALLTMSAACRGAAGGAVPSIEETGGDARQGRVLIERFGCGDCHSIPGVRSADAMTASPLVSFSQRSFINGEVPNTPVNLVRWIQNPQAIEPRTAMPAVGVTERQARDIAAYLYASR